MSLTMLSKVLCYPFFRGPKCSLFMLTGNNFFLGCMQVKTQAFWSQSTARQPLGRQVAGSTFRLQVLKPESLGEEKKKDAAAL